MVIAKHFSKSARFGTLARGRKEKDFSLYQVFKALGWTVKIQFTLVFWKAFYL